MGLSQELYFRTPKSLQSGLITLYGLVRSRKRYGGDYADIHAEIDASRGLSAGDRARWLNLRLTRILIDAAATVPYYRRLFSQLNVDPRTMSGPALLERLPILSKADVRANGAALLAAGQRPFWTTETSGSTGTPLTIALDAYAYRLSMALLARHEADHGISSNDRRATFAGRLLQLLDDDRPPFWRFNWAERQMLCSSYHMSDRNLPAYLDALERFQPVELIGYPSAIYALADFGRRANRRVRLPLRAVITNSETLLDWQRPVIEQCLGAPVYDYYGTAESVVFAAQCHHLRYHADPLMGITEVLDDDGRPVASGQAGRLVCTTTSNRMMPLFRYEIGDTVIPLDSECECGRPGPVWQAVVGRTDDVVITPDGRPIGRLDHVFKGVHGIRECQIAQTAPDRLVLRVVPDVGYSAELADRLRTNARERVGSHMSIDVRIVDAIARTSRGKFRGVVREFS